MAGKILGGGAWWASRSTNDSPPEIVLSGAWLKYDSAPTRWRKPNLIYTLSHQLDPAATEFWKLARWQDALQWNVKERGQPGEDVRKAFDICLLAGEIETAYQLVDAWYDERSPVDKTQDEQEVADLTRRFCLVTGRVRRG